MEFKTIRKYEDRVDYNEMLNLINNDISLLPTNLESDKAILNNNESFKFAYEWRTSTHIRYFKGSAVAEIWNDGQEKHDIIKIPLKDGWYLTDKKYGIPNGKKSNAKNRNARYLTRQEDEDTDCLVVRGFNWSDICEDKKRIVGIGYKSKDGKLGVVIRNSEDKSEEHKNKYKGEYENKYKEYEDKKIKEHEDIFVHIKKSHVILLSCSLVFLLFSYLLYIVDLNPLMKNIAEIITTQSFINILKIFIVGVPLLIIELYILRKNLKTNLLFILLLISLFFSIFSLPLGTTASIITFFTCFILFGYWFFHMSKLGD